MMGGGVAGEGTPVESEGSSAERSEQHARGTTSKRGVHRENQTTDGR